MIANSSWDADPMTVKTTALCLCLSAAEYARTLRYQSPHAKQLDVNRNETMRLVIGWMKATRISHLYKLAGIAPPNIRREAVVRAER